MWTEEYLLAFEKRCEEAGISPCHIGNPTMSAGDIHVSLFADPKDDPSWFGDLAFATPLEEIRAHFIAEALNVFPSALAEIRRFTGRAKYGI